MTGARLGNGFFGSFYEAHVRNLELELRPDDVFLQILITYSQFASHHPLLSQLTRKLTTDTFIPVSTGCQDMVWDEWTPVWTLGEERIQRTPADETDIVEWSKCILRIRYESGTAWQDANFSTTTLFDETISRLVAFSTARRYNSNQNFFMHNMGCDTSYDGFSAVWLQGTVEDWRKLRERVVRGLSALVPLSEELAWWLEILTPILDNFICW